MKTNKHNNFKRMGKIAFIHFGILVALFSNSVSANNFEAMQSEKISVSDSAAMALEKPVLDNTQSDTIETIATGYKKTTEEIIKEDNLIIESDTTNEVFPLDFDKLNKRVSKARRVKHQNSFSHEPSFKA